MPANRQRGMDHEYYTFSPITARPPLHWPEGARLALWVVVHLEYFELDPPAEAYPPPGTAGPLGSVFPNYRVYSQREYGNRVGIWRVMKILDKYGLRATAAVNSAVCERYPFLISEAQKRHWEFIGHGTHASRMITSKMSEQEEAQLIQQCISTLQAATGKAPRGWLGPELGESLHTPRLVAAAGLRYLCDWPNDDQPYPLLVPQGQLISLPYTIELDDFNLFWLRNQPVQVYPQMVRDAFDRLYQEGATSGRILSLGLHPWLIGQPYRIKYLDEALAYICKYQGVWKTTGEEITNWYIEQHQ